MEIMMGVKRKIGSCSAFLRFYAKSEQVTVFSVASLEAQGFSN